MILDIIHMLYFHFIVLIVIPCYTLKVVISWGCRLVRCWANGFRQKTAGGGFLKLRMSPWFPGVRPGFQP